MIGRDRQRKRLVTWSQVYSQSGTEPGRPVAKAIL